jgi:hypothetical protein
MVSVKSFAGLKKKSAAKYYLKFIKNILIYIKKIFNLEDLSLYIK